MVFLFWYNSFMAEPFIESVAKALLINSKKETLILTLGEHKQKPEKSYKRDLPGGLVDPGENEYEAVIREVAEETGIAIQSDELRMVYSKTEFIKDENKSVTKHLFIANVPADIDVTLSWEHSSYSWVPLNSLKNTGLRSFYDEAIKYCFSNSIIGVSS